MRRAGQVVRATQGLAVVRAPPSEGSDHAEIPGIGTELVNESLDAVGQVVDVFGPVDRPYLAVNPTGRDPAAMLGEKVYER